MNKIIKYTALVVILAVIGTAIASTIVVPYDKSGEQTEFGQLYTPRGVWVVVDSTTSTGDEPTDLAVTERTYQAVKTAIAADVSGDGEISVFDIPRSWNAPRFKCIGITDDATVVYQVYFGTLGEGNRHIDSTLANCNLAYGGQLTFTIGTQASTTSTYEMADTLVVAATQTGVTETWDTASPANNRSAETIIDVQGADIMVLVPTTAGCDCKLIAKGY